LGSISFAYPLRGFLKISQDSNGLSPRETAKLSTCGKRSRVSGDEQKVA